MGSPQGERVVLASLLDMTWTFSLATRSDSAIARKHTGAYLIAEDSSLPRLTEYPGLQYLVIPFDLVTYPTVLPLYTILSRPLLLGATVPTRSDFAHPMLGMPMTIPQTVARPA